jgi:hypothetical protein
MEKRKGFNFLRSYYDVLEEIYSDTDKLAYLMAVLDKQFRGIEPQLTGIPRLTYRGQQHNIDKSVEGWEFKMGMELNEPYGDPIVGGSQGGSKDPTTDPTEPPTQDPSGASDMTTEDPTEGGSGDPYLQEQGKEQGKEQEKEQEKKQRNISTNTGRKSHKLPHKEKDIKDIMEHQGCDWDKAIGILDDFETFFNKKKYGI